MYLLFLVVLASFVRFVVPSVASEVNRMIGNLPTTEQRLIEIKNGVVDRYPTLRQPIAGYLRSALTDDRAAAIEVQLASERARLGLTEAGCRRGCAVAPSRRPDVFREYFNRQDQLYLSALMSAQFQRVREYAPAVINMLYRATATILLALLFSFLILIDLARIKRGIGRLWTSKVGDFYEEAAPPIGRFGILLGRAIEAQAAIAFVNTVLTLIGLLLLEDTTRRDAVGRRVRLQLRAGARCPDLDHADRARGAERGRVLAIDGCDRARDRDPRGRSILLNPMI